MRFAVSSHHRLRLPWSTIHVADTEIPPPCHGEPVNLMIYISTAAPAHRLTMLHAQVLEQLKARVTIQVVSGSRVTIKTECFGQDGKLLLDGTALALMPSS